MLTVNEKDEAVHLPTGSVKPPSGLEPVPTSPFNTDNLASPPSRPYTYPLGL